jgi:hypothetical protein
MLIVASAKLSGAPGSTGWAQAHEFDPQDAEKLLIRGRLYIVIATSQVETGIDVIASGRELLSRINEEYYGKLDTKPFYALKAAVQKVASEFAVSLGQVEIGALAVLDEVVYAAAVGGSGVLISRGGALATILESKSEAVVAASGYPKQSDVILLATSEFFKKVPFGVIKAAMNSTNPNDAVETLAPIIHGTDTVGSVCAEILQFKAGEERVQSVFAPTAPQITPPVERTSYKNPFNKLKAMAARFVPKRSIYIKPALTEDVSPQSKKVTFSIALVLLVLLAVSIIFGVKQKKTNDLKNQYKGILEQSVSEVDQAISLAGVSPERSRELFASAQAKLIQIESMNVKDPGLDALRQKINDGKSSILGEYDVPPEMFLDLSLLSSGFKGNQLSFTGGQIYIMDSTGGRIVSVDIATKKSKVVAGPGVISSPTSIAGYESRVFVLQSDGIYEVDSVSTKVVNKTWSGDALISAFAGNIYVVDKSGGAIYRFQGQGSIFGDKQNWLAAGTNVDFTAANQMVIDGSVYLLYPNAKIQKFSQGSPQSFSTRGIVPEIGSIDAISGGPDNQYVYLLDKAGKRVVVTDKRGTYKSQYVDGQISAATNLVASETDKKIILLTGDKLFSIDIKHL